jgi:hypothetical protein
MHQQRSPLLAFCPYGFGGSCTGTDRGTPGESVAQFRHGGLLSDPLNFVE